MLNFIKHFGRYSIHACMVLSVLCILCFINTFVLDNTLGKGVYGATLVLSVALQFFLGLILFYMLDLSEKYDLVDVINMNALTIVLVCFVEFSLITLSLTYNMNFIVAMIPVGVNALLSYNICKRCKMEAKKT